MADPGADIEQLRRELAGAIDAARQAEAEAGELRGTIVEMQTQLARARQDQESYQQLLDAKRQVNERIASFTARLHTRLRTRLSGRQRSSSL